MLEILRQRRWLGFSAFMVVMMVLCVFLARWQWTRYQTRQVENAALDRALGAPAVPVAELLAAVPADDPGGGAGAALPPGLEWRMVSAVGTFDVDQQVAVRRRPLGGRNGFWIVTPLVTDDGVLLVNRGWVAAGGGDAQSTPEVPPPPVGTVTVAGRLRPAETSEHTDPPAGQAWASDPTVLITPASVARFPAYVELRDSDPAADAGLAALPDPGHRGLNNLVYAVQWLLFAAVALFGWWRLLAQESRRSGRRDLAQAAEA